MKRRERQGGRLCCLVLLLLLFTSSCTGNVGVPSTTDPDTRTIAFLRAVPSNPSTLAAFLAELQVAGFHRGRNLSVLAGDSEEAYPEPAEAAEAVRDWHRQGVDLILAFSSSGTLVARDVAPQVHVLFISNDPVATGLVENERQPEGNATGVTFRVPADRTLDLARRAIPGLAAIGLPYPADDAAAEAQRRAVEIAAEELGIELVLEPFDGAEDVERAVAALARRDVDALLLSNSPTATLAIEDTGAAASAHRLPVIANTPLAPWALLTLSPDTDELGRQLARQAARLLTGSSVASVPVEDPRRFLLTINSGIAEEHGIRLDEGLLREAHHVSTS